MKMSPSDAGIVTNNTMWTARLTSGANSSVIGFPCCENAGKYAATTAVVMKTGMPTHLKATAYQPTGSLPATLCRIGTSIDP